MHEEYLDEDGEYWLIIDSMKNKTTHSKCVKWDTDILGPPSEWRIIDVVSEHGGFRGAVVQWGIPVSKRIATVNLYDPEEADEDDYGFGGDWWKG